MKKNLLVAVLILAVITSLTAGTLANYNQTLSITGSAHAKEFHFTRTGTAGFTARLDIVPGQTIKYNVKVDQDMEVPVLYTVTPTFSGSDLLLDRLDKSISFNGAEKVFAPFTVKKLAGEDGFNFEIDLLWPESNDHEADVKAAGNNIWLDISINGVMTTA